MSMKSPRRKKRIMRVPKNPDYGHDDDYIGDDHFTQYTRRDVYSLQRWRAFFRERRSCAGFLVPDRPIPEKLNLVLRGFCGVNWQRAVLSASVEVIVVKLSAGITGFSLTAPRERREFLRLFGVWANAKFRAGLRDLALRCGFLDLDSTFRKSIFGLGVAHTLLYFFSVCAACWYNDIGFAQTSFLKC